MIYPGQVWNDTNGVPIQAHGGCLLQVGDTFYWYGEDKTGKTTNGGNCGNRIDVVGIHVYSSQNLTAWTDRGLALSGSDDPQSDLWRGAVVERPKVLFNAKTGKYVMWMHIDNAAYQKASIGVAVSDTPEGPFDYLRSFRPMYTESRDMTLFQEEDGTAYAIYSSDQNRTLRIERLTEDYLDLDGVGKEVFVDQTREAPAVIRHEGRYYMVTSGCTGWDPNPSLYAVADKMLGHWKLIDNPFEGEEKETSFRSQSTWLFNVPGTDLTVYMGDRWKRYDLADSRYIWLPIEWKNGRMIIRWVDEWEMPKIG